MADHILTSGSTTEDTPDHVHGHYTGEGGTMFKIAGVTSLLTLLTLGIYRFWGKTRIRRYIWSSTTVQGDAFQYTGSGLEKLLGFLVAVIILAFALGILQIGLFYFNLSFFSPTEDEFAFEAQLAAAQASLIFLAPLFFFARYRSLRYKLARTRWRGIRFGMEHGAWGYAWRGVLLSLLTILTLGLMLPYQTYKLTKYRTDRTWFGNARMELNGRWQSLYRAMIHVLIGGAMIVGGFVALVLEGTAQTAGHGGVGGLRVFVGYFWACGGGVPDRVDSFRRLTAMTTLDGEVGFISELKTGDIIWRLFAGGIIVGGVYSLAIGVVTAIFASTFDLIAMPGEGSEGAYAVVAASVVTVFVALLLISVLSMTIIVQPIIRLVINGLTFTNAGAINRIRQRAEDEQVDADGLADALDFGGAI